MTETTVLGGGGGGGGFPKAGLLFVFKLLLTSLETYFVYTETCYLYHRSGVFVIRPPSRTGRAIPASLRLQRIIHWWGLSSERQWHFRVLLH